MFSCNSENSPPSVKLETKVISSKVARVVGARVNGLKEGMWIDYNEDGSIGRCYTYVHDSLIGEEIKFGESGDIFSRRFLNGNKLEGEWVVYHDFLRNHIAEHGAYKNGRKVGIWEYYIDDGRLDKKIEYRGDTSVILINNKLDFEIPSDLGKDLDTNNRVQVDSTRK
jgi:antitoxin component YwqK of YwqJK toxin-antitoxin module